ncbi:MAG: fibro-slime domain-containing protein [Phycisphaeraceae bacterium]|nr:fibro-slime domain-containing protein [Phycisphaeraceae bacterium]
MRTKLAICGLLVAGCLGGSAMAHTIELTGTIRDFRANHPDMQAFLPFGEFAPWVVQGGSANLVYKNMVLPELCDEYKPQLNLPFMYGKHATKGSPQGSDALVTVTFLQDQIFVESSKNLSNVVLVFDDGTDYKYDSLGDRPSPYGHFRVPDEHAGKKIVEAYIKSGSHMHPGGGPGWGRQFIAEEATLSRPMMVHSKETFNQWYRDVPGTNMAIPYTIVLDNGQDEPGGIYTFAKERPDYFFPIDDIGLELKSGRDPHGNWRNFHWTFEINTRFTYTDPEDRDFPMIFKFTGDDDVWVFINGRLAVDLGGVHPQASQTVNLDDNDVRKRLGLVPGGEYRLDVFMAERHTTESNFRIDTTMQLEGVAAGEINPLFD